MKERVLVKYSYQNDQLDKSQNCFFVMKDTDKPLRIIDLLAEFPGLRTREYGEKGYHFRFLDRLGKMTCWVDIKVLTAHVPIIKNVIEMRVLLLPDQSQSAIFGHLQRDFRTREERILKEEYQSSVRDHQGSHSPPKPSPHAAIQSTNHTNPTIRPQPHHHGVSHSHQPPKPAHNPEPSPKTPQLHNPAAFVSDHDFNTTIGSLPTKPPEMVRSTHLPRGGLDEDVDILGGEHSLPHLAPSTTDDHAKMMDMFGDDVDPNVGNRVLYVINVEQKKKKLIQENLKAIDDRNKKILQVQDAKLEAGQILEPKIKQWAMASDGKTKNNIRILLTTMHNIVWEGSEWEQISMADLVADSSVKKIYMKAVMKVHPDQNSEITDPSTLYLMERIFNTLSDSYSDFTKQKK